MKLDVFNHLYPPAYFARLRDAAPARRMAPLWAKLPALTDIDAHFRLMDGFDDYRQVPSLANPPIETLGSPAEAAALARLANDGMAELCARHPDRFPAFTASVAANDVDAAVAEAERAIAGLGARGIQLFTNVLGKPLSAPEFFPLFETLHRHDLPVWVHPARGPDFRDYAGEDRSEDEIWFTFGWPYETTACMTRLIFSGLFDKLPGIKIITHHMGGMIPFFANKIEIGFSQIAHGELGRNPHAERCGLDRQPIEYYRMLRGDTALNGSKPATECGYAFFGADRSLFATDAPFDPTGGGYVIGGTIEAIESLDISDAERRAVFAGNTRELLKLD